MVVAPVPRDVTGRGGPRQEAAATRTNLRPSVDQRADKAIVTAYFVTTLIAGGRTRRRVYLTRVAVARAVECHREAGRTAMITRARLMVAS